MTEVVFGNFWKLLVGFVVLFLLVSSLFHGGGDARPEPFNPNKMSQTPREWPAPAWARNQGGRPERAFNPLRNLELRLQQGLQSIPQDTQNREWQYVPWYQSVPERPKPEPFRFHAQWAAEQCPQR